jgi:hypothetical protein
VSPKTSDWANILVAFSRMPAWQLEWKGGDSGSRIQITFLKYRGFAPTRHGEALRGGGAGRLAAGQYSMGVGMCDDTPRWAC